MENKREAEVKGTSAKGTAPKGTALKGTADEAIGRPGPWGENRYEKKDQPLDQSVRTPPGTSPNEDKPVSKPVTRRDYSGGGQSGNERPGGDAG